MCEDDNLWLILNLLLFVISHSPALNFSSAFHRSPFYTDSKIQPKEWKEGIFHLFSNPPNQPLPHFYSTLSILSPFVLTPLSSTPLPLFERRMSLFPFFEFTFLQRKKAEKKEENFHILLSLCHFSFSPNVLALCCLLFVHSLFDWVCPGFTFVFIMQYYPSINYTSLCVRFFFWNNISSTKGEFFDCSSSEYTPRN